jgi:NADH dehydrogenase (ubiquinone) 1 beta subcomplex subunit 6
LNYKKAISSMVEHSETGGVKPFPIGGRMVRERERCIGMTDQERAWRKQYLKDQILTKNEPKYVEAYWRERTNPIRRFYKAPLDMMHKALTPMLVRIASLNDPVMM